MPPKLKYTKELIIEHGLKILRKEGCSAITARRIAESLKCSTQPVYSVFASINELQEAVVTEAEKLVASFLLKEEKEIEPFLSIGLRYFRLSEEEPELYKLFYVSRHLNSAQKDERSLLPDFLKRMQEDTNLQDLAAPSLERLISNMWIYTHGLISLIYGTQRQEKYEFVRQKLYEMGKIMIEGEHLENKE